MEKIDLVKYELPTWVEFISNDWLQSIIARHYANKVNKKVARYNYRNDREAFFKNLNNK